ncbi:MAG TPA: SpoIIE family protein phosphatase [Terracidiphilus sp.]|nr:SpoIIE family protein phosphatase [Terracidiphilus sp.]
MARTTRLTLWIAVLLAVAAGAAGQAPAPAPDTNPRHFYQPYLGTRVELGPDWLFAAGDDSAYASPGFDDSGWTTVSTDRPLPGYGYGPLAHAWYRMHVHVNPKTKYLAVEIQFTSGSYEVYVNGARIGANGQMSGMIQSDQNYLAAYDVPDRLIAPDGDLVIALHFALDRGGGNGRGTSTPFGGAGIMLASRDAAQIDASYEAAHQAASSWAICGLSLIVGLVALALYLSMRSQVEYLAIAISLLASGLQAGQLAWAHLHVDTARDDLLVTVWLGITNVALIEFVRLILHLRRSPWLLALMVANFLGYFGANLLNTGFMPVRPALTLYFLPALVVKAVLMVLLLRGLRRGNRDARVILPAIAVITIANYWYSLIVVNGTEQWGLSIPPLPHLSIGTYTVDFWRAWDALYCVTMLLFLVLRTVGIVRERVRVAAELEAARAVQHVLIPQEIPTVPGFALESVYKPASEVGGDFFQITPLEAGGVLVVIGDVSGKGMPAAMTVSLLVGTFRTLAHYTQKPSEILAAMNTRMLARSHGGFTTCLVLRADSDGTLTIANAGHIAPYLAGKELPLDNGLPLGLSANTSYSESTFHFTPGQQVTLVTDGVVEARDRTGALFGFERTADLSTRSADEIAKAAALFGQEDDITALTLMVTLTPIPVMA